MAPVVREADKESNVSSSKRNLIARAVWSVIHANSREEVEVLGFIGRVLEAFSRLGGSVAGKILDRHCPSLGAPLLPGTTADRCSQGPWTPCLCLGWLCI